MKTVVTGALRIIGRVKQPPILSFDALCAMETEEPTDIAVNCGEGTPVRKIEGCRGVLLENVIGKAAVIKEDHNDTKKMFIVASASDGYKTVFSWQEIFNTPNRGRRHGPSRHTVPSAFQPFEYFSRAEFYPVSPLGEVSRSRPEDSGEKRLIVRILWLLPENVEVYSIEVVY